MMSSRTDEAPDGDWRATLALLQELQARLSTQAKALRGGLAHPAAGEEGEVVGLGWALEDLPEAKRVALYETVCADLQLLAALTEKLAALSDRLEAHGPIQPPR